MEITTSILFLAASIPCVADSPFVSEARQIDVGETDDKRFSMEYSVAARGLEVVGLWMKRVTEGLPPVPVVDVRRAYSADGGTTWTIGEFEVPGGGGRYDPMSAYDRESGALYIGLLRPDNAVFVARRDTGDPGFTNPPYQATPTEQDQDQPWMGVGRHPDNPSGTRVYVAARQLGGSTKNLVWSDDSGATWSDAIDFEVGASYFCLPRVGANGELFISYRSSTDKIKLVRSLSTDAEGAPELEEFLVYDADLWAGNKLSLPSLFRYGSVPASAVDPNDPDKVFIVFADITPPDGPGANKNIDLYIVKTENATNDPEPTWGTPGIVQGVSVAGDQFFPWLEMTDDGRLHLFFVDGRHTHAQNDEAEEAILDGYFDYYYAYSDDDGETFTEVRLTPTTFNVKSMIEKKLGSWHFYGDYMGMAASRKRAYFIYPTPHETDGRSEATFQCAVFGTESQADSVSVLEGTSPDAVEDLQADDGDRYNVASNPSAIVPETEIEVEFTNTVQSPTEFDLLVEGYANSQSITGKITVYDFTNMEWDTWSAYAVWYDTQIEHWVRGIPADDYIGANGEIKVRIEHLQTGPMGAFTSSYDHVQVIVVE